MEAIIVLLLAYIAYKLYSNEQRRKVETRKQNTDNELQQPYRTSTPVREYIFSRIKYAYAPDIQPNVSISFYSLFAYNLLPIFNDRNDPLVFSPYGDRLKSDVLILFFMPCYWFLIMTHAVANKYDTKYFYACLNDAAEQFLYDYCFVTGLNIEDAKHFYSERMEYYSNKLELVSTPKNESLDIFLLNSYIIDFKDKYLIDNVPNGDEIINKHIINYLTTRLPNAYQTIHYFALNVINNR